MAQPLASLSGFESVPLVERASGQALVPGDDGPANRAMRELALLLAYDDAPIENKWSAGATLRLVLISGFAFWSLAGLAIYAILR